MGGIDKLFSGGGGDLLLLTLINFQNTNLTVVVDFLAKISCSIDKSPLLSNEIEGGILYIVTLIP